MKPMPPSFSFIYYFLGKICYPNKSHIPWKYSLQVSSFFIVSYFQYSWQSSGYEAHSVGWAWSRIVIMQADPCFKLSSHSKYPSLPYCTVWQYGLWSFQTGGTKLERFLPENQQNQRKLLDFENWVNGEVSKIGHHFSK